MRHTIWQMAASRRVWMHAPFGIVNAMLFVEYPALAAGLLVGVLAYQALQEWCIQDGSHVDVLGHLVGMAVVAVPLAVLEVASWL